MTRPVTRLRVVIDARERDGARGYHLCAAMMLVERDFASHDLRLAAPLDREEAQAFEAFCFDRGLDRSALAQVGDGAPDLLLLAVDGDQALSGHAGFIGTARHRVVAGLSRAVDDHEAITVSGLAAHDTRHLAGLIEAAFDAAARGRGLAAA